MNRGQSLVEVIVASGVIIMLVTGLIAGTTRALHASQSARNRSLGTKYSQEAIEIARNDRDQYWNQFQALDLTVNPVGGDPTYYCLGASDTSYIGLLLPDQSSAGSVECLNNIPGSYGAFTRFISFDWQPGNTPSRMVVSVQVEWREGSSIRNSHVTSYFTNWR